jgi:hypothetical protein
MTTEHGIESRRKIRIGVVGQRPLGMSGMMGASCEKPLVESSACIICVLCVDPDIGEGQVLLANTLVIKEGLQSTRRYIRHWAIKVFPVLVAPNTANMVGGVVGAADAILVSDRSFPKLKNKNQFYKV